MRLIREVVLTVLCVLVFSVALRAYVVHPYRIEDISMLPSFREGDWVMVNRFVYNVSPPHRGEVIVFRTPWKSDLLYIKRVIGLPGDRVKANGGRIYINGAPLTEPAFIQPFSYSLEERAIPPGEYFVLGDNRAVSHDSHSNWLVPEANVIGRVWFTYWPPPRLKVMNGYAEPQVARAGS